eukprot:1357_1
MGTAFSLKGWFPGPVESKRVKKLQAIAKGTEVSHWLKEYRKIRMEGKPFKFDFPRDAVDVEDESGEPVVIEAKDIHHEIVKLIASHRKDITSLEHEDSGWLKAFKAAEGKMFGSSKIKAKSTAPVESAKMKEWRESDERREAEAAEGREPARKIAHEVMEQYITSFPASRIEPSCDHFVDAYIKIIWAFSAYESSPENLDFILESEKMITQYLKDHDQTTAEEEMKRLYDEYLAMGSPMSINISYELRKDLETHFKALKTGLHGKKVKWMDPTDSSGHWQSIYTALNRLMRGSYQRFGMTKEFRLFIANWQADLEKCPEVEAAEGTEAKSVDYDNYYNHELSVFDGSSHYQYQPFDDHNRHMSLISGEYHGIGAPGSESSLLIGGVVGASSVVIIMLIFCLGLAFGMIIYWGYSQKRALDVQKKKGEMRNWIDDENNEEV